MSLTSVVLAGMLESIAFHAPPHVADVISMQMVDPGRGRGYIQDANPLLGRDPDLVRILALKIPVVVGLSILDHHAGKRNKKLVWVGRIGVWAGYGWIVSRNLRVGKERGMP